METRFSLYFDGAFWIGVLERDMDGVVSATRHIFGPEPGNAELRAFMLGPFAEMVGRLALGPAMAESGERPAPRTNPKRAFRLAAKAQARPLSTKSQAALALAKEAEAELRSRDRALRRREAAARRFEERTERRKEKRRGR